jgi:hypothetical protein
MLSICYGDFFEDGLELEMKSFGKQEKTHAKIEMRKKPRKMYK